MNQEYIPTSIIGPPQSAKQPNLLETGGRGPETNNRLELEFERFPEVGDLFADCRLLAKLGRGGSGQAFLAKQEKLADRPIVLKITTDAVREEHLNLARLQHTHIMPLYWESAFPKTGMRVLAMPYLARTTLARLVERMANIPRASWNGRRAFEVLQEDQANMPVQIAVQEHHAEILRESSWCDFVLRLGQTLAEALAYAHHRGLIHLDLKPSNILVTPDGQPILLDLDIARQPVQPGTTAVPWFGGTRQYMSPEHRAAMDALVSSRAVPEAVDNRSDLYSLAMVLFDALGGKRDANERITAKGLRKLQAFTGWGPVDILARALNDEPRSRYQNGDAFAEDLRRHLNDLPMCCVRNRWSDRWRKWRKRRPLGLALVLLIGGFCAAAAVAGMEIYGANEDRRRRIEAALLDGQEWQRKGQHEAAAKRLLEGKELAEQTFGAEHLQEQINRRLVQTQRLQKADELDRVVHLMRFYALQERTPRRLEWVLEAAGRRLWAERHTLIDLSSGKLEEAAENTIRANLQEFVVLWTDLHVRITPPSHLAVAKREVEAVLEEAERLFGASLGLSVANEQQGRMAGPRPEPRAPWEFCTLSRIEMKKGNEAESLRFAQAALDMDPLGFVPNFCFGICALRQHRYELAIRALSYCAGQNPSAECFLLRGQALAALGETERALGDFDRAIAKNRELGSAYTHRSKLNQKLGRHAEAETDRQLAAKFGE